MKISTSVFIKSSAKLIQCPKTDLPEFAFIGRSNVGKSSLINMLLGNRKIAKISSTPGKTNTINHFLINDSIYIADLPGYGYAKVSKTTRGKWHDLITDYLLKRDNLYCVFSLIDSRHAPMAIDIEFINMLGENGVPFILVFTKSDKVSGNVLNSNLELYRKELSKYWEDIPTMIPTSSKSAKGKEDLLSFINNCLIDQSPEI